MRKASGRAGLDTNHLSMQQVVQSLASLTLHESQRQFRELLKVLAQCFRSATVHDCEALS